MASIFVVSQECLVGLVHRVDAVLGGEGSGSDRVSRRHCGTDDPIVGSARFDESRGRDSGGAEATDPKRFHRSILRQIKP